MRVGNCKIVLGLGNIELFSKGWEEFVEKGIDKEKKNPWNREKITTFYLHSSKEILGRKWPKKKKMKVVQKKTVIKNLVRAA